MRPTSGHTPKARELGSAKQLTRPGMGCPSSTAGNCTHHLVSVDDCRYLDVRQCVGRILRPFLFAPMALKLRRHRALVQGASTGA